MKCTVPGSGATCRSRQYAEKHNLIVRAMRKVDPTLKVIASGSTPEEASWCYVENRQFGTFEGREK